MLDTLRATWHLCAWVSIVFALFVPLVSSTILVAGTEGQVVDFDQIQDGLSENRDWASVQRVPTRRLEGIEKFTYQFKHPQFFGFYMKSVSFSFLWFFLATIAVSHLARQRQPADESDRPGDIL